jgi:proton glutamate symport protein
MIFFVLIVLGLIARWCGIHIFTIMKILKDEMVLAFSTASSEAVLPKLIEKMERFGCPKAITSFVIPTGYSFNLDGSTIYQSIGALFIAQMYGIDMSIPEQLTLVLVLMVTSKGIAGVPGASFVVLLATLGAMGLPMEGLAFIADVIGNSLAAIVMSKWEGQFNEQKAQNYIKSLEASKQTNVA